MDGETIGGLLHPGCGLHPPCLWNWPPHGCRDAQSWVILFDFNSLPLEAFQLGLDPNHIGCEMALKCSDSSPAQWRYCACNTIVSSDCCNFFHGLLMSCSLLMRNMTSETHHIIYQNDPHDLRNCSIFFKISFLTSSKKLGSVTEKMWELLCFCYKTGCDIIPLKLV